ncbi:hypothetical protein Tco_1235889 [Tanacetum coccineum]
MLWEWRGIANMDFIKLGGSSRVLSDFCREVWEQKQGAGWFWYWRESWGKGLYKLGCDRERLKMIKGMFDPQGFEEAEDEQDVEPSRGIINQKNSQSISSQKATWSQPKSSEMELEYHFEECYKAITDRLDWTKPEGHEYPFDLSKPLPLIEDQGRQVVPGNYFINNDLEYLKGGSLSRKYMTSTTKTKAGKYDTIEGIEDMVPSLWSPVKIAYDKFAMWGITHWVQNDNVTYVKAKKWYDCGYLEEIKVPREDQQLYKFKEGDFPRLNLRDIEDVLLLLDYKKLFNLERDVLYHLNVALLTIAEKIKTAERVSTIKGWIKTEEKIKIAYVIRMKAPKKGRTQKNLLKQQYENFVASSTEVIEQTYERLQKLISQLEMHGEVIPQEDINQKFLRSLSQEWTMHTIMWRNKPEIKTLSLDDLFKHGFCASSTNSVTRAVNTAQGVNTARTQDPQFDNEDLYIQINPDDSRRDGFAVEHCYADYKGKKILEEYRKEAGHGQQRKNWVLISPSGSGFISIKKKQDTSEGSAEAPRN